MSHPRATHDSVFGAAHIREWLSPASPLEDYSESLKSLPHDAPAEAIRDSRLRRHRANGFALVKDHIPPNGSFTARVFVTVCDIHDRLHRAVMIFVVVSVKTHLLPLRVRLPPWV